MPLGVDRQRREINLGDSAELESYVLSGDDQPVDPDSIVSIEYTVEKPDGTTFQDTGQVQGNGSGLLLYYDTDQVGKYTVTARHEFSDGRVRTDRFYFSVIDPLNPPPLSKTEEVIEKTWERFEDLFDSEYGGPWLRDMSLTYFNKDKIKDFMGEAILLINTYPPATHLTILDFTGQVVDPENPGEFIEDPDERLLTLALEIAIIRHLIRSYVEQPNLVGAQAVYEDRRDYLQRWQSVLQSEEEHFYKLLALWKRQFYGFYNNKILVHSKAGRQYGPGIRQRNAARGYW
jgi:hypothetical protein